MSKFAPKKKNQAATGSPKTLNEPLKNLRSEQSTSIRSKKNSQVADILDFRRGNSCANSEEFKEETVMSSGRGDRFKNFIDQSNYPATSASHNHSRERTTRDTTSNKDNINSQKGSTTLSTTTPPTNVTMQSQNL